MSVPTGRRLAIQLLGQPQFFENGRPFRPALSRPALSLLAFLLIKRHAPVSRAAAALAVWPDDDEESARGALRRELYRIGKALPATDGDPWIAVDGLDLRWNDRADAWLDVAEFEAAAVLPERLADSADLYGGELLEGYSDEWIFADRERLRSAHTSVLVALLARARSVRDYERAIGYAGRILTSDPFREDIVRQSMLSRYESGDRAGALSEAMKYAKLYREELGVGLMPETEALRFTISQGEATSDESDAHALQAKAARANVELRGRALSPPFVGRSSAFESARDAWHGAMRGGGTTLFVGGEAGIGKSRFVSELGLLAERQGCRVLVGHTSSPERLPYESIATALGSVLPLVASVRAEPAMRRSIERIVPALANDTVADACEGARETVREGERQQVALFASLAHYVRALARTRPLFLVFEDVHWARPSTLVALESLARALAGSRALAIVTFRADEAGDAFERMRDRLVADGHGRSLPLGRLAADDVRDIVRAVERREPIDAGVVESLVRFADGNPFYLVEGIAALAIPGGDVPQRSELLADAIASRIARLSEEVVDVASVAATIGARFSFETLRRVCGFDEGVLLDAIARLIDARVLAETTGRTSFDYAFTHHLMQTAIYDRIEEPKRRRRHRIVARVLEERLGSERGAASEIARHFDLAEAAEEAARWYGRAADHAVRSYAHDEAEKLLARAIELSPPGGQRFDLLAMRQSLRASISDLPGEAEDLDALAREAVAFDDDDAGALVANRRLGRALRSRDPVAIETAIAALTAHPVAAERAPVSLAIAQMRLAVLRNENDAAIAHARAGLAVSGVSASDAERVELLCELAVLLFRRGEVIEARERLDRATQIGLSDDGNVSLVARTHRAAGKVAYELGRFVEAAEFVTAAIEAFKRIGERAGLANAYILRGQIYTMLRRLPEARDDCSAAIEIFRALGRHYHFVAALISSSTLDGDNGEVERAEAACDRAIEEARQHDFTSLFGNAYHLKSFYRILVGDFESARSFARTAYETESNGAQMLQAADALDNLASAESELGDYERACEHFERAIAILEAVRSGTELAGLRAEYAFALAKSGKVSNARDIAAALLGIPVDAVGYTWRHLTFQRLYQTLDLAGEDAYALGALRSACRAFSLHFAVVDDESRERFLALPRHRELFAAAERLGLADELPSAPLSVRA